MAVLHRFLGEEKGSWFWEGVEKKGYPSGEGPQDPRGVSVCWLVGRNEQAPYFAVRYFEVQPGGQTIFDQHQHDHGVFVLRGRGKVLVGEKEYEVGFGDVIYIPPQEVHQLKNVGEDIFAFLCVIANKDLLKEMGVLSQR